jgi:hypothetical protein
VTQLQQWGQQAPQQFAPQPQAPQQWGPPASGQQSWAPEQAYQQTQNQQAAQQWAPQPPAAPALPPAAVQQVEDTSGMFGGAPSISWNTAAGYTLGTPRGGQILGKVVQQQTDFETKKPLHFPDGKPRMSVVVTVQTTERTDANDDGKRTLYVANGLVRAAADAFRKVGAADLEIGGWIYAANTAKNGGRSGKQNVFQCLYARPGQPDPLAHLPAYVAPVAAPAQPQAPQQFQAPVQPSYPQPGQQQFQQPQAPAPQFGAPPVQQGYADPNQGQQQFAPQPPAQPQFAQQGAPQGGGAPADYNPFAPQ